MEEEKVKMVLDQLTSNGVKNIQKFLGLANYYRQFIQDFTFIVRLLHDLVKKIEIGLDRKAGEDIQRVEGEVYKRTSVNSTRLRQKREYKSMYQIMQQKRFVDEV